MAAHIVDHSKIMKYLASENIFGLTAKCMKANGKETKCMDRVCSYGETAKGTRANLSMIRGKEEESSNGGTVVSTMACGTMVDSTA